MITHPSEVHDIRALLEIHLVVQTGCLQAIQTAVRVGADNLGVVLS